MLVTSEYRFGTIRPTFLFTPRRSRVVGAKLAAGLLAGIVFGVVGEATRLRDRLRMPRRTRHPTRARRRRDSRSSCSERSPGVALWGAIGVGLGAIVRNQVGAIIGLLAWGFVVENLLFAFVPSVGRFTPGHAENALTGLTTDHLLSAAAGGAVLLAWAAALALARRRAHRTPRRQLETRRGTRTKPAADGRVSALLGDRGDRT